MTDTKAAIVEVAYIAFINTGYHHTSMQQLVSASGLSKGAFYHYFSSKEALYREVIDHYFLSFYRTTDWAAFAEQQLTLGQIEQEIHRFYRHFVPQILAVTPSGMAAYYIMYFEAYRMLPHFKQEVQDFYKRLEALLVHAIIDDREHAQAKARTLIARYEGLLFLLAIRPELELDQLLAEISI